MTHPGSFLIVGWDGGGNTPPLLNLGARLVARGQHVRMLGWESMAQRARSVGAEFASYPSVPPWPHELAFDDAIEDRLDPALNSAATRNDIVAEATAYAPDVLVIDCMMKAAFDAAGVLRLPTAALFHLSFAGWSHEWPDEHQRAERAATLRELGAILALAPPGFEAPCPMPANAAYVGPITDPRPPKPLELLDAELLTSPGNPWVLLSLSTTQQGQAQALPKLLDAIAPLPVRVLLTLGGALPVDAVRAPRNVTVRGFIPHDILIPHMSAVISHGGLSTIMAALTAGVPVLCIPQGRDQHDNAARVSASGAGRALAPDAPPAALAAALEDLLADDAARRAAGRFRASIADLGAGEVATAKIVDLLPTRTASCSRAASVPDPKIVTRAIPTKPH